ncbi:hypothetical protein [Levilactobacillus acidifarinae]|uniref:Uncharacterized protein n=1 Tax=Levilactobacillus acidifarinae DSM 19394 = JCM 15949 TaxID=1423715 RepID=A0A0R1LLD4_9LACO|nr:hypothetical protein [Levilactobacillus acidifarinae]KRK93812.1 hypothetical protein FD25_GL001139 [Levilactobacillus acidifarinae DSM 19394]GEO68695.1 hypothetical protein LAC03_06050 [Levilactobacillus acidifarinae]
MASNSDSIYNVLTYIHRHPQRVDFIAQRNSNVVSIGVPDTVPVANVELYFPTDRLVVNRLDEDFLAMHGDLLNDFFDRTRSSKLDYQDVWVTTGYVPGQHAYLVELSFE